MYSFQGTNISHRWQKENHLPNLSNLLWCELFVPRSQYHPPNNQSKNDDICLTKLSKPCKESMGSSWTLGLYQAPAAPAPLLAAEAMRRGSPAWHPAMRERGTPLRGADHKDVLLWPTRQIAVYCGLCLWIWVLFWKFLIFSRMISLMLE